MPNKGVLTLRGSAVLSLVSLIKCEWHDVIFIDLNVTDGLQMHSAYTHFALVDASLRFLFRLRWERSRSAIELLGIM